MKLQKTCCCPKDSLGSLPYETDLPSLITCSLSRFSRRRAQINSAAKNHEAEADSQRARAGKDKHCCPYHKKRETEDDPEKTLSLLHRLRQSQILTTEFEVFVLHDLLFSPSCRTGGPSQNRAVLLLSVQGLPTLCGTCASEEAVGRCGAFLIQFLDARRRVCLLFHHFFATMCALA